MYFKSKTKQYLLIIALTETAPIVMDFVMLTFSAKTLWMEIYSIVGPNICLLSVSTVKQERHMQRIPDITI